MKYAGLCGPSNPSQSLLADCEQTMNFYLEQVQSPYAPVSTALYPTPGQRAFLTTNEIGLRAGLYVNGRLFVVFGGGFYECFANGTATRIASVAQDNYPATISSNGVGGHLFITSGGNGYCYVLASGAFTTVLTGEATMGGMVNARFLAFNINNGKVRMSALNDGTTWDALLYYQRTIQPDPWQAMIVRGPDIFMIGESTGEVWQDTGASPQPFAPYAGAVFSYGIASPFAVTVAGDSVTWLARAREGADRIVSTRGYTPQPISNYAIETAISRFNRTASIADAEMLSYEQEGHLFGVFSFPSGRSTWAIDLETSFAHELGTWNAPQNRYDVWSPRVHVFAFGKHLVGNRTTGTLYELDVTFGSEADGSPIRRLRVGPPLLANPRQRLQVSRFELLVETGLGVTSGQGVDPLVMLRTSKNGKTWSRERQKSAGAMGQYNRRVVWNRCGSSTKVWIPEITMSDGIPWRLSGAQIEGSGFQAMASRAA